MQVTELDAKLAEACAGWTERQWCMLRTASDEEREAIAQIMTDQPDGPGPSGWTVALGVLGALATVAGDLTGIGGLYALVKSLAKG